MTDERSARPDDPAIMGRLDAVICQQTDCAGRGTNPTPGSCMYCADIADAVIAAFLRLKGLSAELPPGYRVLDNELRREVLLVHDDRGKGMVFPTRAAAAAWAWRHNHAFDNG